MWIGIDPSLSGTGVAVCKADENGRFSWSVRSFGSDPCSESVVDRVNRYTRLASRIVAFIRECAGPSRQGGVAIEGYSFGSAAVSRAHQAGEFGGELRRQLVADGWSVSECPPSTLKVFATGNGHAKKQQMLIAAVRFCGVNAPLNSDEADAVCLAAWASSGNLVAWESRNSTRKAKQ